MENKQLRSHWIEATRTNEKTGQVEFGYECANCHRFEKEPNITLRCQGCEAWMSGFFAAISKKKDDHPAQKYGLWMGNPTNDAGYCACPKCGGMEMRSASYMDANDHRYFIARAACRGCGYEMIERHFVYAINFHEVIPSIEEKLRVKFNNAAAAARANVTEECAPFVTWNEMISNAKHPEDKADAIVIFMMAVDNAYPDYDSRMTSVRVNCVREVLMRPYTGTEKASYQLPKVNFRANYEGVWDEVPHESDSVKSPAIMNAQEFVDYVAEQFPDHHAYMTVEEFFHKLDKMLAIIE